MKQFLYLKMSASGKAEFFYWRAENANANANANKGRINKIWKTERKPVILMTIACWSISTLYYSVALAQYILYSFEMKNLYIVAATSTA